MSEPRDKTVRVNSGGAKKEAPSILLEEVFRWQSSMISVSSFEL
jgi:hypothetical protein